MSKYIDLKVVDGDFVLNGAGDITPITDQESIGQDLKHMLIETGLVLQMVGERSAAVRVQLENKMLIQVENDTRLKPGTARIIHANTVGQFYITAVTNDYGDLKIYLQG